MRLGTVSTLVGSLVIGGLASTLALQAASPVPRPSKEFTIILPSGQQKLLSSYRGNLQWLEKIIQAGEMPDAEDATAKPLVGLLKRYLAKNGTSESQDFLLRLGLIMPGVMRGIHPPILVLSPERGGFSEKRLEEAASQVGRFREILGDCR